ncbi:hypothetical protein [Chitinimonas lacunae]|uniref:Pre-toxin TG domain-containing protein n=1 Tax=Chitinimonas lacunae TaxID=1963018 RepID=A0ABV8MVS7_9NEIS
MINGKAIYRTAEGSFTDEVGGDLDAAKFAKLRRIADQDEADRITAHNRERYAIKDANVRATVLIPSDREATKRANEELGIRQQRLHQQLLELDAPHQPWANAEANSAAIEARLKEYDGLNLIGRTVKYSLDWLDKNDRKIDEIAVDGDGTTTAAISFLKPVMRLGTDVLRNSAGMIGVIGDSKLRGEAIKGITHLAQNYDKVIPAAFEKWNAQSFHKKLEDGFVGIGSMLLPAPAMAKGQELLGRGLGKTLGFVTELTPVAKTIDKVTPLTLPLVKAGDWVIKKANSALEYLGTTAARLPGAEKLIFAYEYAANTTVRGAGRDIGAAVWGESQERLSYGARVADTPMNSAIRATLNETLSSMERGGLKVSVDNHMGRAVAAFDGDGMISSFRYNSQTIRKVDVLEERHHYANIGKYNHGMSATRMELQAKRDLLLSHNMSWEVKKGLLNNIVALRKGEYFESAQARGRLFSVPNSFSGAAFTEGKFLHDIVPRTNLEIYGEAISRTPSEAKEILLKIGHDAETLDGYNFVKLTQSQYERMVRDRGGMHFDAAYGTVPPGSRSVSFADNISSRMASGESRVPVWVRPQVFESDEAIAQVLSHEIHEIENLRYDLYHPVSTGAYYEKIAPNIPNNLHFDAVKEGDFMLLKLRQLLGQ